MYAIWNEEKNEFFINHREHPVFPTKSGAANAFNYLARLNERKCLKENKSWKLVEAELRIKR